MRCALALIFAVSVLAQVPAPATLGVNLQHSLDALQTAVAAIQPDQAAVPKAERAALADSQASITRNVAQAVPGLLASFQAAPTDLGAAFRLYRDVDAVLVVAERTRDALPADDNGDVAAAARSLRAGLDQLGDWIEQQGAAQFARLTARPPAPPKPAGPPPTLVIGDANAPPPSPKPKAKPAPPKIPH